MLPDGRIDGSLTCVWRTHACLLAAGCACSPLYPHCPRVWTPHPRRLDGTRHRRSLDSPLLTHLVRLCSLSMLLLPLSSCLSSSVSSSTSSLSFFTPATTLTLITVLIILNATLFLGHVIVFILVAVLLALIVLCIVVAAAPVVITYSLSTSVASSSAVVALPLAVVE